MIDEEICALLGPLVNGEVHPLRRPQRDPGAPVVLPIIIYTHVGDDWATANTLCGPGLHDMRVQIDCYTEHYREARNLAYAVAEQMNTIGSLLSMQPFPDDDEKIYRWLLEFSVWRNVRRENVPAWVPPTARRKVNA